MFFEKRKIKRLTAFIILFTLIFTSAVLSMSYAEPEDEIDKKEKQLEKVQGEKDEIYGELNELSRKIEAKEASIAKVTASISKKSEQIKKTEKKLSKMKRKISTRKTNLNQRIRAMYKNGVIGYLDIILNSHDVTELITNIDMVQKIYKADQKTLDSLVEQRLKIEAQEATLKKEKEELKEKEEDLADKKASLDEMNEKLKVKYQRLKAEEERLEAEIEEIVKAEAVYDEDGNIVSLPRKYKGGKWECPVRGHYNVNRYGEYLAARSYERHPGIDMSAPTGTPIYAAADGTVIKSGWYGGYGNAVVISHGSGITSLYGHNSSVSVSVGQSVKKGELIAKMGSTGWSTGSHCHFEVRQNGALRNPRDFCYIHGPNS